MMAAKGGFAWRETAKASGEQLVALVDGAALRIVRLGQDRYGRTLGEVYADSANISCSMIAAGQAVYVDRWDDPERVRQDCPDAVD